MNTTPRLYVFAVSHYCEKAAWALDHFDIGYRRVTVAPGLHAIISKRLGAASTTVPILRDGAKIVQGSGQIIDWAEAQVGRHRARRASLRPRDPDAAQIEDRLGRCLGVHIRRHYYAEAMVEHPAMARAVFCIDLSPANRAVLRASWPMLRPAMIRSMDLGRRQQDESAAVIERELDWLDGLLADGRVYLSGGALSRLDLTAASMLAPIVRPAMHAVYADMPLPPRVQQTFEQWRGRPAIGWAARIYETERPIPNVHRPE